MALVEWEFGEDELWGSPLASLPSERQCQTRRLFAWRATVRVLQFPELQNGECTSIAIARRRQTGLSRDRVRLCPASGHVLQEIANWCADENEA